MKYLLLVLLFSFQAHAQVKHKLFRKVAVFPIADAHYSTSEDAWWQMREQLTKDEKLLVATRRFMTNRGVFQPRKELKPADVIILGKLLDAEALITTFVNDRVIKAKVYNAEAGSLLWEGETFFHPAIPVSEQLIRASSKLMSEFLASIPYQGFQVVDEKKSELIWDVDNNMHTWVFVGNNMQIQAGDPVQWVELSNNLAGPFLGASLKSTVVAEGEVIERIGDKIEVRITKAREKTDLFERALVRFPREEEKLKQIYLSEEKSATLGQEYLTGEMKPVADFQKQNSQTATALAFVANLAMFVLLGF